MPVPRRDRRGGSYADLQLHWQDLLEKVGASVPDLDLETSPLSKALNELRELRDIQKGLLGARRRITKRLREVKGEGKQQARRLKGLMTWHQGANAG